MRQLQISKGEAAKWRHDAKAQEEGVISVLEHQQVIKHMEDHFYLATIEYAQNLESLRNENAKLQIVLYVVFPFML